MMKSYLRYEPRKAFGVISAPVCNVAFDFSGNLALTGGVQSVGVWNLRQATNVATLTDPSSQTNYPYCELGEVTVLVRSPDKQTVAVGYSTGEVRLFNYINDSLVATLRGHRSGVTSLAFDVAATSEDQGMGGLFLASGGADTDIFLWDVVSLVAVARLRGHRDAVTGVGFLSRPGNSSTHEEGTIQQPLLVSVSKDTQLKVWDPETRHCLQTLLGHRAEIWCLTVFSSQSGIRVLTGCSDDQIRGYRLRGDADPIVDDEDNVLVACGSVVRPGSGSDRCAGLAISPQNDMLAAQSSGKTLTFYRVRNGADSRAKTRRRMRRQRERDAKAAENGSWAEDGADSDSDNDEEAGEDGDALDSSAMLLVDELELVTTLRCQAKVRGCAWHPVSKSGEPARLLVSLSSNCLEMYKVPRARGTLSAAELVPAKTMLLDLQGHRSDVRAVAVSGDGLTIATCSTDGVKLWSGSTHQCMRTCSHDAEGEIFGTCIAFAPGGRLLVLGTKNGTCQLLDASSGECLQSVDCAHHMPGSQKNAAHAGSDSEDADGGRIGSAIWAVAVRPDGKGFCTGGADKMVKFWEFCEAEADSGPGGRAGGVRATIEKQLQMESDVLCLAYNHQKSADKLLVAIGLLDSTVKLFFDDSMKFFLSLYGHKLPVLSLDISSDGKILVSGSADKTIKIWGLDFGDCHRSLVGHKDSVTCIRFQTDTHYFFSCSKDGSVKYWDADRFEQVLHLPGHKGPVWALDVSRDGSFAISGGQDRSLRLWERGEDLVFVEEEREKALEAVAERAAGDDSNTNGPTPEGVLTAGETELTAARKSLESVRSGELLMDAVDLVEAELADQEQYAIKLASGAHTRLAKRVPNVQLLGLEPLAYLMRCLRIIKQPELEQSLLVLPFHYVTRLLKLLIEMSQQSKYDMELCCRCSVFLLRCHFQQIVAARAFIQEIQDLQSAVRSNITSLRTLVGTNLAGLRHMKRAHDEDNLKYLNGAADLPLVPTVLESQQGKTKGSKAKKRKVK